MDLPRAIPAFTGFALALLAVGCSPSKGYHPKADVPENQARVHKPDYRGGEIEAGELDEPEPNPNVERGDPPARVGAAWSDPQGNQPPVQVTAVTIERSLADLCGIDAMRARFEYDSAKLDEDARATVAEVADCFDTGPLAGHEVEVVGHADPRGTDAYNRELGMSRAESVADVLVRNGVPKDRLEVESSGEAKASSDPQEWPEDRRVEVRVNQ